MKSSLKIYGIAFLIAFTIVTICISIELSILNKAVEVNYSSTQERISKSFLEKGYNKYIIENSENDDSFEQFCCFITNFTEGLNNSEIKASEAGGLVVTDVFRYYDSDFNSLMKENTLMLIMNESDNDSSMRKYYTYQDDSLTEQMQNVFKEYEGKIDTVVFHVTDGYIKDHEFVPSKLTYYSVGQGGSLSKKIDLYTTVKDKESMEKDGYSFYSIDDEFTIGQISDSLSSESFIIYCKEIDSERMDRVNYLLKEAQKLKKHSSDNRIFIRKKPGLFTSEFFCLNEYSPDDGTGPYYAVCYQKKNILYDFLSYCTSSDYGLILVGLMFVEIFAGILLALLGAYIVQRRQKKKALEQDNS